MIYIDPPYNTGNDFIYKDKFHIDGKSYREQTGQEKDGIKLISNPNSSGRFHSDWISFMYARLYLARNLLREDSVIFVSIDDNEVHNLRLILDEIFGEENFIGQIIVNVNRSGRRYKEIATNQEYILCYSKYEDITLNQIPKNNNNLKFKDKKGKYDLIELRNRNPKFTRSNRPNLFYPIYINIKSSNVYNECAISTIKTKKYNLAVFPKNSKNEDDCWRWSKKKLEENIADKPESSEIVARQRRDGGWNIYKKDRNTTTKIKSIWDEKEVRTENGTIQLNSIFKKEVFQHPKPIELILKCIRLASHENSIILDFFAGSGTTAHAVMELNKEDGGNRKFICVQIPEKNETANNKEFPTIAEICKERIRRAIKKLKDTPNKDQDLGFKVFKLAKSNYKIWENYKGKDVKKLKEQMKLFENPFITEHRDIDVIYECIIKEGLDLNCKIEKVMTKPNTVYHITKEKTLYICLDKTIHKKTVENLCLSENDTFICIDAALNDSQKTNLSMTCRLKTV